MKNHKLVEHCFGGSWTEIKLDILKKYLSFYTTALKNKKFELLYIDAFAGSGTRTERIPESPIFDETEQKIVYDGSTKIALDVIPKFDRYLFIDNNPKRYDALNIIKDSHPDIKITVTKDDANKVIQEIAKKPIWNSNKYRGVIFLDPYGNHVEWKTLEAISSTKSFDVWFLFPISGVYRQASHDFNKIENYKKENLNKMFGTASWENAFYKQSEQSGQSDIFGESGDKKERIKVEEIEKWVKNRLKECFYYVSSPLPLPQKGAQLFSLFFCVSNPSDKALGLALRAANHILNKHEK